MPDLPTIRQQIRIRARQDAAAGRLLGTLQGTENWLRLQEVPEDQWDDLMSCYTESYDEATGLQM